MLSYYYLCSVSNKVSLTFLRKVKREIIKFPNSPQKSMDYLVTKQEINVITYKRSDNSYNK